MDDLGRNLERAARARPDDQAAWERWRCHLARSDDPYAELDHAVRQLKSARAHLRTLHGLHRTVIGRSWTAEDIDEGRLDGLSACWRNRYMQVQARVNALIAVREERVHRTLRSLARRGLAEPQGEAGKVARAQRLNWTARQTTRAVLRSLRQPAPPRPRSRVSQAIDDQRRAELDAVRPMTGSGPIRVQARLNADALGIAAGIHRTQTRGWERQCPCGQGRLIVAHESQDPAVLAVWCLRPGPLSPDERLGLVRVQQPQWQGLDQLSTMRGHWLMDRVLEHVRAWCEGGAHNWPDTQIPTLEIEPEPAGSWGRNAGGRCPCGGSLTLLDRRLRADRVEVRAYCDRPYLSHGVVGDPEPGCPVAVALITQVPAAPQYNGDLDQLAHAVQAGLEAWGNVPVLIETDMDRWGNSLAIGRTRRLTGAELTELLREGVRP